MLGGAQPQALTALAETLGVAPARLAIHRNTALGTLVSALALSFPAVRAIVGADFFEAAAHGFVVTHLPTRACLNDYGRDFACFLAQFPAAAALTYLADVARLEWAVNRALHAPEATPLALDALAALDPARMPGVSFVAHPALTVLRLETPADAIWRAVLDQDETAMAALNITTGPVWLLIERSVSGVQVRRLSAGSGPLTERLCAGEPLQRTLDALDGSDAPAAAFEAVLAEHLAAGRFTGWIEPGV